MIYQPSQYDCDKMEKGDVVFVRPVSSLYKIYRKFFRKDLNKIKVRVNWLEPVQYNEYYQEDCTLLYAYELACVQKLDGIIPCSFSSKIGNKPYKIKRLKRAQVDLYNIQLELDDNTAIAFPLSYIRRAFEENQKTLKLYDDRRKIQDAIKFQKYKGEYFKNYAIENNIKEWVPVYCAVCGKPVVFTFNEEEVNVKNNCECKSLNFPFAKLSYDEFALWYINQIVTPSILERYNRTWFKRGD